MREMFRHSSPGRRWRTGRTTIGALGLAGGLIGGAGTTPHVSATTATTATATTVTVPDGTCETDVPVPDDAEHPQQVSGDVDGDAVADAVTVYAVGGAWHVNVVSSVKGLQSDTTLSLDVQDWVAPSFENIDHAEGADPPPPVAILAIGTRANDQEFLGDFTFLTLNQNYCVGQWSYQDEPFQWVALQEPGHMTGMECDADDGSIAFVLTDSLQNDDGSWSVDRRVLTHDFTTANVDEPGTDTQTVAEADFSADQYGNIFQCTHPALTVGDDVTTTTAPASTAAPSSTPATGPTPPDSTPTSSGATDPTINGEAFITAWSNGDDDTVAQLGTADAIAEIHAQDDIRSGPWTQTSADGGAGSMYSTYQDPAGNEVMIGVYTAPPTPEQPYVVNSVEFTLASSTGS